MAVIVELSAALICFLGSCYPALIGQTTPVGEYRLEQRQTTHYGYGGDLLVFKDDGHQLFAVRRLVNFEPGQRRYHRIHSKKVGDRIITDGCINLEPDVYQKLVDCCAKDILVISK